MLAIAAAATACGGGAGVEELTIEDRNATASPAVAYESGAGFVEALEQAGVLCMNPTISPVIASGIHVADTFGCTRAENDFVNVFSAWPDTFSSKYFSLYFESYVEAGASTGSQGLILKGELWLATAGPDRQMLFDVQEAIGGQLCLPQDCVIPSGEGG